MEKLSLRVRRNTTKTIQKDNITYRSITSQLAHDFRKEEIEKGYLSKPENTSKNIYWLNNKVKYEDIEEDLNKRLLEIKKDYFDFHKQVYSTKTKEYLTGVLTFESNFSLSEADAQKQFNSVGNFLVKKFGAKCLISLVAHKDEKSLHYHFSTFNYDFKTHKTISRYLDTSLMQDEIADHLSAEGLDFGHKRGVKKLESKAKHLEVRETQEIEKRNVAKQLEENNLKIIELQKEIEDLKAEKKENENNLTQSQKDLKELESQIMEIIKDIESMAEDKTTPTNFLNNLLRYIKTENKERLKNLLEKGKRAKAAIEAKNKSNQVRIANNKAEANKGVKNEVKTI